MPGGSDTSEWTKTYTDIVSRNFKTAFAAASAPYPATVSLLQFTRPTYESDRSRQRFHAFSPTMIRVSKLTRSWTATEITRLISMGTIASHSLQMIVVSDNGDDRSPKSDVRLEAGSASTSNLISTAGELSRWSAILEYHLEQQSADNESQSDILRFCFTDIESPQMLHQTARIRYQATSLVA